MKCLGNEEIGIGRTRCWPDGKSVDLLMSVDSLSVSVNLLSAPKEKFLAHFFWPEFS